MPTAVIEDWDGFKAFLATQPLCKWSAQKRQELALQMDGTGGGASGQPRPPKNDNADLAAALASMA